MNKVIAFAALLGVSLAAYTNEDTPRSVLNVAGVMDLSYVYSADLKYETYYDSGPVSGKPDLNFERASFNISSHL